MCGASIQIGFLLRSVPPLTNKVSESGTIFLFSGSYSHIQIARWPSYNGSPGGGQLWVMYTLPSSSKNMEGSIPSTSGKKIGSDQGPAVSVAVTLKLPPPSTLVVIM